jgi:hypothetical protein
VRSVAGIAALIYFAVTANADALCIYGGKLYAKTTIEREFRDSGIVIKGTVLSEKEIVLTAAGEKDSEPGVVYRIRVDHAFKGAPANVIEDFSERDSGGFYLDAGNQYLLFLNPMADDDPAKGVAPGALRVNYNCGQSQPWNGLQVDTEELLAKLSARSPQP